MISLKETVDQPVVLPLALQEVLEGLEKLYPHVQWGMNWEKKKGGVLSYTVPVILDEHKISEEVEGTCFFSSPLEMISISQEDLGFRLIMDAVANYAQHTNNGKVTP